MTLSQAYEILKSHQEWRRGAEIAMQQPKTLGIAIDIILSYVHDTSNNYDK